MSLLCGLFLFLIMLLALSAATANNVRYEHHLSNRCIASHAYNYKKLNNETVHFVHGSDAWSKIQIDVLESVLQKYDARNVHLVVVGYNKSIEEDTPLSISASTAYPTVKRIVLKKRENVGKKIKILKVFEVKREPRRKRRSLSKPTQQKTLRDILRLYPDIVLETLNYTEAFYNSPLINTWQNLNEKTRLFAIRTIYLWQYGGLSFDLLEENYKDFSRYKYNTNQEANETSSIESVVALGLTAFRKLPKGVVTIDDKGWHMESKTSCHAFFGDMLMNLRRATTDVAPEEIIKRTLKVFCKKGGIDSGYCSSVQK